MAERRWEVPLDVAREARRLAPAATGVDAARLRDLGSRMPVGRATLLALLASGVNGHVGGWAQRLYSSSLDTARDAEIRVLTAAGIESPCLDACYGILAASEHVDVVTAVLRASADGTERWGTDGWEVLTADAEPVGMRYMELAGDLLTDALDATGSGHGLMLRATTPKAFLPKRIPLTASACAHDGVYAAVDEVDTTAVLDVLRVADGTAWAREDGQWVPGVETVTHLLAAGVPLALLPAADVAPTLRQVDDHDAVFPVVAADVVPGDGISGADTSIPQDSTPDFSDGVMVALPLDDQTAQQLAVPGGLDPDEMHVTLAYLGDTGEVPVDMDGLTELVAQWAAGQQPLSGEVSGPATFEGTDNADNPVQVALADVPGLPEARQSLLDHLAGNGIEQQSGHSFTPHVTRAYSPDPQPSDGLGGTPLNFDQVGVWHGSDQRSIPLGASVTAAFNPAEHRDPTGKWTSGGNTAKQNQALEANRKTTAPHAGPAAKTVVTKPYTVPGGGGGGGGGSAGSKKAAAAKKAAAKAAALAKKSALRKTVAAQEKAERDAETAKHQAFTQAYAAEGLAEQQRRIAFMKAYAGTPKAQRPAMQHREQQRRLAWQTSRATSQAAENTRHQAAGKKIAADKAKLDAKLAADLAAIDAAVAKEYPPTGTAAPAKAPAKKAPPKAPVKASADPVVADAVAHTRTPRQLEDYWVRGKGVARVRWGESGDWSRCVRLLSKYVHNEYAVKGQCNELHKIATGLWPAQHAKLDRGGK